MRSWLSTLFIGNSEMVAVGVGSGWGRSGANPRDRCAKRERLGRLLNFLYELEVQNGVIHRGRKVKSDLMLRNIALLIRFSFANGWSRLGRCPSTWGTGETCREAGSVGLERYTLRTA